MRRARRARRSTRRRSPRRARRASRRAGRRRPPSRSRGTPAPARRGCVSRPCAPRRGRLRCAAPSPNDSCGRRTVCALLRQMAGRCCRPGVGRTEHSVGGSSASDEAARRHTHSSTLQHLGELFLDHASGHFEEVEGVVERCEQLADGRIRVRGRDVDVRLPDGSVFERARMGGALRPSARRGRLDVPGDRSAPWTTTPMRGQ